MKQIPMTPGYRRLTTSVLAILALALIWSLLPTPAAAHPMGNFTVNRYSRVEFSQDDVRIVYILDFAEVPTYQEMLIIDTDGDGLASEAELRAYLDVRLPQLLDGIDIVVGDDVLPLDVADASAVTIPGLANMPTLRIDAVFSSSLPDGWQDAPSGSYIDRNFEDRLGWRELIIVGGPGVDISSTTALTEDVSNELRDYPEGSSTQPLLLTEATFSLAPGSGPISRDSNRAAQSAENVRELAGDTRATSGVAALLTTHSLTPPVIAVAFAMALAWGAAHALSPGHGKAVVAAYLVGARGTARHAVFLGLTVTITHTIGVFALGGVTLYLSRYILPEDLYPWLNVGSGLLVIAIGISLVYSRLRAVRKHSHDHDHGSFELPVTHSHGGRTHTHLPPGSHGTPVTWKALLALGVSGGLIPCPSALVLLLGAISLDRLEFGMLLVGAFSVGLAAVLTGIGLLLVYARRFFERFSFTPRVPRLLPIASAAAISLAGVLIVIGSLRDTGIV